MKEKSYRSKDSGGPFLGHMCRILCSGGFDQAELRGTYFAVETEFTESVVAVFVFFYGFELNEGLGLFGLLLNPSNLKLPVGHHYTLLSLSLS